MRCRSDDACKMTGCPQWVKGKQVKGLCELVTVNTENSCIWKSGHWVKPGRPAAVC